MALTPQQREEALAIVERSGGRIPLFQIEMPDDMAEMTPAQREAVAEQMSNDICKRIDAFLENVYNQALVEHTIAYRDSLPPEKRDFE